MITEYRYDLLDEVWLEHDVIVKEQDDFSVDHAQGAISRSGEAAQGNILNIRKFERRPDLGTLLSEELRHLLSTFIADALVDNDQLLGNGGLTQNAADCERQIARPVLRRNSDG